MKGHFRDMCIDATSFGCVVDVDFVLGELGLYELCDSRVEVDPRDTKKIIKKIRKEFVLGGLI